MRRRLSPGAKGSLELSRLTRSSASLFAFFRSEAHSSSPHGRRLLSVCLSWDHTSVFTSRSFINVNASPQCMRFPVASEGDNFALVWLNAVSLRTRLRVHLWRSYLCLRSYARACFSLSVSLLVCFSPLILPLIGVFVYATSPI